LDLKKEHHHGSKISRKANKGVENQMAGSLNMCCLIGNLGADPEIRRTQSGNAIANLRIATSESWKDKTSGERKEKTEWHRIVIFNENLAKIAEQYLKKGSKIYVQGQLQTRKWTDQQGVERYSTEVVLQGYSATLTMLDTPRGEDRSGQQSRNTEAPAAAPAAKPRDDLDDTIPF
jgi:single-strand DNA-binding protein